MVVHDSCLQTLEKINKFPLHKIIKFQSCVILEQENVNNKLHLQAHTH